MHLGLHSGCPPRRVLSTRSIPSCSLITFQITMRGYLSLPALLKPTQNSHTVPFFGNLHVARWHTFLTPYPALWTSKTTSSNLKLPRSSQFFYHLKLHQSRQTYSNRSSTPSRRSWLHRFLTNVILPFNVWRDCFPDVKCARLSGEFPK